MAKKRDKVEVEGGADLKAVIKVVNLHGVEVEIKGSLIDTVRSVDDLRDSDVLPLYAKLTGDSNPFVDPTAARSVVKGVVQERWYTEHGREYPDAVRKRQEERVATAKKSTAKKAAATDGTPRKTAAKKSAAKKAAPAKKKEAATSTSAGPRTNGKRALIRQLLKSGVKDVDKVVSQVNAKLGNDSCSRKDVVWNRNKMIEAGELDAPKE